MTDGPVRVTAEWALYTGSGSPPGPRLLSSSRGAAEPGGFEDVLAESAAAIPPGRLEVTISALAGPGDGRLGFVIHNAPRPWDLDLGGDHPRVTACFSIPYDQLAAGPVSYRAMYDDLSELRLPVGDQGMIETWLRPMTAPVTSLGQLGGNYAMTAAALLMTAKSVCMLGANDLATIERLRFLDEVLALLPYGVRGQLPVATWVATGPQAFRLFFGEAAAIADCHTVTWGQDAVLPTNDRMADSYLKWLRENGTLPRSQLAKMTTPMQLDPAGIASILDGLGIGVNGAEALRPRDLVRRRRIDSKPTAFFSYVRTDDEYERGRLTELRKKLGEALRFYTGHELVIFQDQNIKIGEDWERQIALALDSAAIFIPIITPSYLTSEFCRYELKTFLARERELGRSDLVFPVYYVDCPEMEDQDLRLEDSVASILAARQAKDWRELRGIDRPDSSPEVQRAVEEIAIQMRDRLTAQRLRSHPGLPVPAPRQTRLPAQPDLVSVSGLGAVPRRGGAPRPLMSGQPYNTILVDPYGQGNFREIGDAIAAAGQGDHILVRPGRYQLPDRRSLVIDKPLVIEGDGQREDIVVAATGADVIRFEAGIGRIANLTLRQEGGGARWNCVFITGGQLELEACDITCRSLSGVSIANGADPRLRYNIIHDCRQSGVLIYNSGRGLLDDNEIYENAQAGVEVKTGSNPQLTHNRIRDSGDGILVHSGGLGVFEDNEIQGMRQYGVAVKGSSPTLRKNSIHDCGRVGVYIYDRGEGILKDNDIYAHGSSGVVISSGARPTLSANRIHHCTESGVLIYDGGMGILEGNRIYRNLLNGVEIREASRAVLQRNEINGNGRRALLALPGAGMEQEGNVVDGVRVGDGNSRNRLSALFKRRSSRLNRGI